jgi:hypothetical protein
MSFRELCIFEDLRDELFFRHRRERSFLHLIIVDIVGIVIPYVDTILDQKSDIRVSAKEPEELSDHSFPVDPLGREEWESILEFETKLPAEKAIRHISTSEIFVIDTIFDQVSTEVEVLFFWMDRHRRKSD